MINSKLTRQKIKAEHQVLIAAIIFISLGLLLQFWRMQTLNSSMDQGILYQVLWNSLNGHPFESTLSSQLSTNVQHSGEVPTVGYQRLGQHFTPLLFIWLPFIQVLGKWGLPFIQVFLIGGAGLILHQIAKRKLEPELAKIITFAFYCANTVIGPCLGNFTDLSQLPICFFLLILGLEIRKKWMVAIAAIAIPLIREDAGVLLLGIGLWILYKDIRRWKLSLLLILYGGAWVVLATNIFMPIFSDDSSKRFMIENFGQYLEGKSQASSLEVLGEISKQPVLIIKELFSPFDKTIKYLAGHGLPLVFIPYISIDSWLLMGLPLLGLLLAQGNPLGINWRYTYLVVPGLFTGAVFWWEKNGRVFNSKRFKRFWSGCICLSLIFTITSNPNGTLSFISPESFDPWVYRNPLEQWEHGQIGRDLIKVIPDEATVAANNPLIPHLAGREVLIRYPRIKYKDREGDTKFVEWIALDFYHHQRVAFAFEKRRRELEELIQKVKSLEGLYSIQAVNDGIIIFSLGGESNPIALEKYKNLLSTALN